MHCPHGKTYRNGRIGCDLIQDFLGARGQAIRADYLVDEANPECSLATMGFPGQNDLQRTTLSDQARQPLRPAETVDDAELHFTLTERCVIRRKSQRTGHRDLASASEGEAVHGCDDGLPSCSMRSSLAWPHRVNDSACMAKMDAISVMSAPAAKALSPAPETLQYQGATCPIHHEGHPEREQR
jgi:hypothetical protein